MAIVLDYPTECGKLLPMKKMNLMGEMVAPRKLSVVMEGVVAYVKRGGVAFGIIKRNGWTGKSISIDFEVNEPILQIFAPNAELSLKEMQFLTDEWHRLESAAEVDTP